MGGGAFANDKIRKKNLSDCTSVWLNIGLEELKKRLKNTNKRPLIQKNGYENLIKLLSERKKYYSLANYEINCNNLNQNQITKKVIELYEKV